MITHITSFSKSHETTSSLTPFFTYAKCKVYVGLTHEEAMILAWDHNNDNDYIQQMSSIERVKFFHHEYLDMKQKFGKDYLQSTLAWMIHLFSFYMHWMVLITHLLVIDRIKTNVNRGSSFRFINAIEYITVGYFDEIKKQRIKEYSNMVGGSNPLVHATFSRKLRHVTTTQQGLVSPYQKPQRLMMR